MKRGRLSAARALLAAGIVTSVLGAHYGLEVHRGAGEGARLAALTDRHVADSQWSAFRFDLRPVIRLDELQVNVDSIEQTVPRHPFIIPLPERADSWIGEWRIPVTEEERARWRPRSFNGMEYFIAPLADGAIAGAVQFPRE